MITTEKDPYFFEKLLKFTYTSASIKEVQATGEAFSLQRRTSSTSKHEISPLFSIIMGYFCPPESISASGSSRPN
jgi:hypothetical protein